MKDRLDFVLINPPSPEGKISNKDMMGGFGQLYNKSQNQDEAKIPSIDLAYICGESKKNNLNFFVIDGLVQQISNEEIIEEIQISNPKYIFIRTSTPSFNWDIKLAEKIKKEGVKVFFFGPCIQQMKDIAINKAEIDGIILTEAEQVIPSIILFGLKNTKGIWFKEKNKIIKNNNLPFIEKLDELAFPAWEYLPYTQYQLGRQINYETPL